MARVRHSGTAPELAVRRLLRRLRIRFTTSNRDLPGSPDIANRRDKWALFIHGCFWHRHEGCSQTTTPRTNKLFWLQKFRDNRLRDTRKGSQLRRLGFK